MDELARLLSHDECPKPGTKGHDVGWYEVAPLPLRSGELWVGDPTFSWAELIGGDGTRVALEPGGYAVRAFVVAFADGHFVARLRVCRDGVGELATGAELAQVGTDSSAIGACDAGEVLSAFRSRFGDDVNAGARFLERFDYARVGLLSPSEGTPAGVVYVNSGFGDGAGPVYELLDAGGRRVGIELPFIEPGATA